jgi:FkbM family methyltransferase
MDFNILVNNGYKFDSILDVGAHAGKFTFGCKKFYPNAYYYMIDGNPITEQYVSKSGIDYKIAYLSDTVKETVVYKTKHNSFNTGDSLYRENTRYYNDESVIKQNIKTTTLDEIFKNEKTFNFIKIDSQGSEMDIINGGLEMCKRADVFLLEASVYPYNTGAPMLNMLQPFMAELGFPFTKIVSDIHHPDHREILIQHDILFSKRSII